MSVPYPKYIEVLMPLALPKNYTYSVPETLSREIEFGKRVEVMLRNKFYSGIIINVYDNDFEPQYKTKNIISIIDKLPIIEANHLDLWKWISEYYMCTLGEVMNAALPTGLKISSETVIEFIQSDEDDIFTEFTDEEYLIYEALELRKKLNIKEIQEIIGKRNIQYLINSLMDKNLVSLREEMVSTYSPKRIKLLKLKDEDLNDKKTLELFEKVKRSKHKTNVLLSYFQLNKQNGFVEKSELLKLSNAGSNVIKQLVDSEILVESSKIISRLKSWNKTKNELPTLSHIQQEAINNITESFKEKNHVLLHGVTGSGKTRIYQEFIKSTIESGGQVLFLVPEIGLTSQLINRLTDVFADDVYIFHSKLNSQERVEIWNSAREGKPIILAARSGLFLPFKNLQLIIVDEEHDNSFKQQSPSPYYNARDVAAYIGNKEDIKIIFGSATPSLESIYNSRIGKYGYVSIDSRFGNVNLPEIKVIDMRIKSLLMADNSKYSIPLMAGIQHTINNEEQILLFQNRRGYSPVVICNNCGWTGTCPNCDVSLTYHKFSNEIKCHYCGYRRSNPDKCPDCGSLKLNYLGYGTEKIEKELEKLFPDLKIKRMDLDTTRTKSELENLMAEFESLKIDILVGTQMISKGLDFDKIGMVGIIDIDRLMYFPDFRANERAFQLALQVGGRAGRRDKQGLVLIQSYNPDSLFIKDVIQHDFDSFTERELEERSLFKYPPFTRLIEIGIFHKKPDKTRAGAQIMADELKKIKDINIIGPSVPGIGKLKGMYQYSILIKIEKSGINLSKVKWNISKAKDKVLTSEGFKTLRVVIDVDPY